MKNGFHIKSFIWMIMVVAAIAATTFCACGKATGGSSDHAEKTVKLVASDNPLYVITPSIACCEVGGEAEFEIETVPGVVISGADITDRYELLESGINFGGSRRYRLRMSDISHTQVVEAFTRRLSMTITYHGGDGAAIICDESRYETLDRDSVTVKESIYHLGVNTARADELFEKEGYTLVGWRIGSPDADNIISCGSRMPAPDDENVVTDLYAVWEKWSDDSLFTYEPMGDGVTISGSTTSDFSGKLVIPGKINGKIVHGIKSGAFSDLEENELVLPCRLLRIESGAFSGGSIDTVFIPDDIGDLSSRAFSDTQIRTIRMISASPRVYSGSYFDSFSDKMASLRAVEDEHKIVLFSGSSARFGYDSIALEQAFPGSKVVNMGVFAYTNALPQLRLIEGCLKSDDILLLSPEFDAAQSQFCIRDLLEWQIFAMCEGDYDILTDLDMTRYSGVWQAVSGYLTGRKGMKACDESVSVFGVDEDGQISDSPVYSDRGDYILYRPDAEDDAPIYDLPVDYRVASFPYESYIRPFNDICSEIGDKGVRVLFTYGPRNIEALSDESTASERAKLDKYLRSNLVIPVISDIEDSLYPGRYLYGTDNHLSSEGVRIRTERVIKDLKENL